MFCSFCEVIFLLSFRFSGRKCNQTSYQLLFLRFISFFQSPFDLVTVSKNEWYIQFNLAWSLCSSFKMPITCGSNIIKPIKSGGFHLLESWVPERGTASFIEMEAELAFFAEQNMATCSTEVQTAAERNSCLYLQDSNCCSLEGKCGFD